MPDSPFAGTQTTLFAFSVSKRSVPVDQRVVRAMEQLMAWNPGGPGNDATGHLFDQWLAALQTKNAGVALLRGEGPVRHELRRPAHDHARRDLGHGRRAAAPRPATRCCSPR